MCLFSDSDDSFRDQPETTRFMPSAQALPRRCWWACAPRFAHPTNIYPRRVKSGRSCPGLDPGSRRGFRRGEKQKARRDFAEPVFSNYSKSARVSSEDNS